jgi:hypothetical protein
MLTQFYFKNKKYLHQCDDIIVITNGRITEHGSFDHLMRQRGHLAKLIGEHVQIMKPILEETSEVEEEEEEEPNRAEDATVSDKIVATVTKSIESAVTNIATDKKGGTDLSKGQLINRRRLSNASGRQVGEKTDAEISRMIEEQQLMLMDSRRGSTVSGVDPITILERNRLSLMIHVDEEDAESDIMPSDAEPMKLVLEDQSVNYKKSPLWSYLTASVGAFISIFLISFFFLSYGVRMGIGLYIIITKITFFHKWVRINSLFPSHLI